MRKGWEYKKLGEVATYINGYAFKPDQWKESGTPIVRIQNLNNENTPYNYYDGEVPDKVKIQNGDLLISWSASLGAYIWHGGNAFLNQHIFKVAFDKTDIDKFFLKYAVTSKLAAMAEQVHGATMKHIVKKDFDNTQIPYPPLSTQLAIVSELDKINELIRLKKEQLKDFDNLAQSLFYEMFGDPVENEKGWEVKKLNDICDVRDGTHDSPKYLQNSEYILITSKNIVNGSIDFENVNYISEEDYIKINKRSKVDNGDIIMPMIGTIGNPIIAHIDGTHKFCIKNVALIKFLADSTVNNMFIVNLMRCSSFSSYLLNQNKGGTQKFVALGAIRKLPIPLPPLPLQQLFAQRIEQIEREKSEVQKSIQDLETLLASRMQYWFE